MRVKTILFYYILLSTLFSCSKKNQEISGSIEADISKHTKNFDKVAIYMDKNEYRGDSLEISDTISAKEGKFEYHFKIKQPKHISFTLLKNKKCIGKITFVNKISKNASSLGNPLVGNEKIKIYVDSVYKPEKFGGINHYNVEIDGSNEAEMEMKIIFQRKKASVESITKQPSCYALLYQLKEDREKHSVPDLKKMLALFSNELKKSPCYQIIQEYIKNSVNLKENGYKENFKWLDINTKIHDFEEARKGRQMVLLVFWASWCGPCRAEIPNLKKFYEKYNKHVSMVSLSIDSDFNYWKKAVEKEKMPWLNLSGLPSSKNGVSREYNINAVPNLILLDKNGKTIINNLNDLPLITAIVDKKIKP